MDFPKTIEGFGYKFSEEGKLQNIESGNSFNFEVKKDDHSYNQKHYEALGEVVTEHIYELLQERCGLKKYPVPCNAAKNDAQTFIFCSKNFIEAEKLLILIHGSGVVRAGQWARRLIINDSLNSGTQIPFIEKGLEEGYGVVVMNTNDCRVDSMPIKTSEDPQKHGIYVWKTYIRRCLASHIAIIAHSYGGVVTTVLMDKFYEEFRNRVFAIALTDSVHFGCRNVGFLKKVGQNWVTSSLVKDTPVLRNSNDIACVSAGCDTHEMTSWSSFSSIFKFLGDKLAVSLSNQKAPFESSIKEHMDQGPRKSSGESSKVEVATDALEEEWDKSISNSKKKTLKRLRYEETL